MYSHSELELNFDENIVVFPAHLTSLAAQLAQLANHICVCHHTTML